MMDEEELVTRLLALLDPDPAREGLQDTPRRFLKALKELTAGNHADPCAILGRTFSAEGYDEIICVRDVPFVSLCEHHVLPFTGTVDVAYIPGDTNEIVGLSKIPRAIHAITRRLQVQERATRQIADALVKTLEPVGVAVVMRGHHSCMALRGVQTSGEMVTSVMEGVFRDDADARHEVLTLLRGNR